MYKTEGINLRSDILGESDKIITLLTKDHGKIKAVAKGARKITSKFGGRLEIFTYNNLLLSEGKSLDIINQCETIENFYKLREDPLKLAAGTYIIKLINASTEIGQRNDELFKLLLTSLYQLTNSIDYEVFKKIFEIKLIDLEGYFPVLDRCVKCSKIVKNEPQKVLFNPSLGGVLCSSCSKQVHSGIEIPYEIAKIMLKARDDEIENLKDLKIEQKLLRKLDLILKTYISDHIGKDIRRW